MDLFAVTRITHELRLLTDRIAGKLVTAQCPASFEITTNVKFTVNIPLRRLRKPTRSILAKIQPPNNLCNQLEWGGWEKR